MEVQILDQQVEEVGVLVEQDLIQQVLVYLVRLVEQVEQVYQVHFLVHVLLTQVVVEEVV